MSNLNDFGSALMAAALLAAGLSLPLKIAWAVLLSWTTVQILWLRRVRALSVPPIVETPKPRPRATKKKVEAAPADSSGDLLRDLGVQVHASSGSLDSAYR